MSQRQERPNNSSQVLLAEMIASICADGIRIFSISPMDCCTIAKRANAWTALDGKRRSGFLRGSEIAHLVSGGYQMFLRTPTGKTEAAQASQLKALHAFDEDVREVIGVTSLYNEGLGTTSEEHLYDRVVSRDAGVPKRPWQR